MLLALLAACIGRVSIAEEPDYALWVVRPDGTGARQLARVDGYRRHMSPRWSHDGTRVAFEAANKGSNVRELFVVNADGTGLQKIGVGSDPDWSPDDKQLVCSVRGPQGYEIYVQNLDGKGRTRIASGTTPRWSPDGGQLAFVRDSNLFVVDLVTLEERALFDQPFHQFFNGTAWSPDGKQLAIVVRRAAGQPREVLLVDARGAKHGELVLAKSEPGGFISFSPDGKQLVMCSGYMLQTVATDGKSRPRMLTDQKGKSVTPDWSPDGKLIAFSNNRPPPEPEQDKGAALRTWKFEPLKQHTKGTIVYGLAFTPDGRNLVLGCDPVNTGVQVWNPTSDEKKNLGGQGLRVHMFPDGRRFATAWLGPLIQIIDLENGKVLREINQGNRVWALGVSRDGHRLVSGGVDKIVRVWNADNGEQLLTYEGHKDHVTRAIFMPDGKEVATVGHDHTLRVWNAETGAERLVVEHPDAVWGLAVTPDGRYILTGTGGSLQSSLIVLKIGQGTDNVLRMLDARTGQVVREMKGHTDVVYSVDVSPDGRLAATGSSDGTMGLWDLSNGTLLGRTKPGQGRVACVAFSPDGSLIAAGGGARRIDGDIVQFPDEEVRLYKLTSTAAPATKP